VTVRDLKLATQYESDFQRASEAIRHVALANQGQLQAVGKALQQVALGNHRQLQVVSEAFRTVVAEATRTHPQTVAQQSTLPRQEVPTDSRPTQPNQLPIAQLVLHATFTLLVAFLVMAYMQAKLADEPEESLLNLLFALWFWYEVHSEFWNGPE
jgi:hypothetical protein